jgi:lipoprotein-releasing system permease protein
VFRPLAVNIGLRYASSRRSFVSFISLVAIAGLVLSVAVLLLVTSVMNGFERELRTRILGVVPHVVVHPRRALGDVHALERTVEALPGVAGAAPFVDGQGLLAANDRVAGVAIVGIDPGDEERVSDLSGYMTSGRLRALAEQRFGVVLGRRTAERLGLTTGDRVTLVLPEGAVTIVGLIPRQKRLRVVGIFETHSELDARAAYLSMPDAQRLVGVPPQTFGLHVRAHDVFAAEDVARAIAATLGPERAVAVTWMRQHGNLYRAIAFQRAMMFLLLSLLVAVAAFNLVSALVMVVNQRRGDVAILRTLGADTGSIVGAFVTLGAVIGVVGVAAGIALGAGGALAVEDGYRWLESRFRLTLMSQYFISYLPSELRLADVVRVAVVALLLCVGSAVYPAWRAAALRPAEVLRHE